MKREVEDYIEDIIDAMDKAMNFVKNMSYEEFIQDDKTIFAVVRALEITGEAVKDIQEEFEAIFDKIPERLKHLDFPKVYLYSKFWLSFYTVAKYGLEKLGVGAEKLFEKEEAELALKHADKCKSVASQLESYIKHPW
jgi:hypothetical protein